MSQKTVAIRGVVFTWVTHIVAIGVAFFVTPVLLRTLGPAQYGIWSIVMALTGYYGLVNMGISKANTKYIAQFDAIGDVDAVRQVVSTGFVILSALAVVVVSLAVAVAWAFPHVFEIGSFPVATARWIVVLVGLKVAVELVAQVFRSGLVARKRFDLINAIQSSSLIITGVLMVVVVSSGGGLLGMAFVVLGVGMIAAVSNWSLAVRIVSVPGPSVRSVRREIARMQFGFGFFELVIQLTRRFSTYGGGLVLGILAGPAAVAYYAVAESLTRRGVNLGKAVSNVVMPFASQFDAERDRYAMRRLLLSSTRALLGLGLLLAVGIFTLGETFLRLWVGTDVAVRVFPVLCVLGVAVVLKLPATGLQASLTGMGRMRFLSGMALAEGLTMLVLGVVLTPLYGAVGMAWAVLLAQLPIVGLVIPVYACRAIGIGLRRFAAQALMPAIVSAVPCGAFAWLLADWWPAQSLLQVVFQIGAVAGLGAISCFVVCLDRDTRTAALRSVAPSTQRAKKDVALGPDVQAESSHDLEALSPVE